MYDFNGMTAVVTGGSCGIGKAVVDLKSEIEKMREQVQNIE